MTILRALRHGLLAASTLTLAVGCGDLDDGGRPEPVEAVERGGTVVVADVADISTPVAIVATTVLDGNLASDVLNMELVRGDWQDGELVYETAEENPLAMARSYEPVGPDSTGLRFHLRSGLRWSDGRPLTARDVAFTYELLRSPELGSQMTGYTERLDSVVAHNDTTVTFYFRERYPEMLAHTAVAPVPQHVFQGTAPAQLRSHPSILDPGNGRLVVSGPFQIGEWIKGQRVTLVPNPHFRPQPNLDRIVIRVIPETTTRLVELQTGGVDFMQNVTFDQIPNLRAQAPHVRFEREEKRFYDYIAYNPKGFEPFADPEVRRALGLAIDVPGLLRALQMEEYAVPGSGPYSPIFRNLYDPQQTPPLGHDPERARQILESKGWRDTDGDGIRDKNGRPFRFTMMTNTGNQRRADAMQIVQRQWRDIGVDVQLQQRELNSMMESLIGQEYQAALAGWQVGLQADLTPLWGADSPLNITGYRNPEVSALMERARSQPTPEAAAPYWRQAAALMARDQPYTWLYYMDGVDGVNQRVRGMEVDSYGYWQNAWEWWVPSAQRREAPVTATASPS